MRTALAALIAFSPLIIALPSNTPDSISPQPEPPAAIHALRDRTKLKYEVVGIVGAYLVWLIGTILLIVLVGKRLRKRNQDPHMTMLKTFHTNERVVEVPLAFESPSLKSMKSPKSPSKLSGIKPWGKKHRPTGSAYSTSTLNSVQHEQHKAKDMDDLTKLYAAVLAHDEERSQGQNSTAQSPTSPTERSSRSPGYPPEFAHLHNVHTNTYHSQGSVLNQALHHPMAPTPIENSFPEESTDYYDHNIPSRASSRNMKSTPLSFVSDGSSRAGSFLSSRSRPSRISIRGQNISQPMGSADLRDAHLYEETVPLSPRVYSPGPPPPTPGKKKQVQITVEAVPEQYPPPQQQYQSYQQDYSQQQQQQQYQPYKQQAYAQDQYQQHEQEQYSIPPQQQYQQPALAQTINNKRIPQPLAHRSATSTNSALASNHYDPANTSKTLPFRDMYNDISMRSAPATKTTFLDRPTKLPTGPKTGVVPLTPYSPYTPMTPMTPITPRRLMNKQELKAQRKEAKLKVLNEDDLVQEDDDMWGK